MTELTVELCPETGICSIIKGDGRKVDLMPDEVEAIRGADRDVVAVRAVIAGCDADFASALDIRELRQVFGSV